MMNLIQSEINFGFTSSGEFFLPLKRLKEETFGFGALLPGSDDSYVLTSFMFLVVVLSHQPLISLSAWGGWRWCR